MHESFGNPRLTDLEMLILRYLFQFGLPVPSDDVCSEMRLSPNDIDIHLATLRDLGLLKIEVPKLSKKLSKVSSSVILTGEGRHIAIML
jgi:hypothetical protein